MCGVYTGHHTVYIGVHVPKSYHRRRRHRRRLSHKEKIERLNEGVSDKSDAENLDDCASSILKPPSKSHDVKISSIALGFQSPPQCNNNSTYFVMLILPTLICPVQIPNQ